MSHHITALYHDVAEADPAAHALLAAGIDTSDISLLTTEGSASHFGLRERTKAPEGAVAGGVAGGALAAIAATLVTAATGGVGILATGPILVGLAGLGAGAAVGGLAGALAGAGVPEHEAKFYEREMRDRNAILIGVSTADRSDEDRIKDILGRFNPARISEEA